MKRSTIVLAGVLSMTAGAALAALGPQFGLPQNWSMTNTTGYGTQAGLNGNPGSAMCVECHTVNPSERILQIMKGGTGTFDPNTLPATSSSGSHFVINVQAGASNAPWGITNSGGGFTGDATGAARDGGQYLRRGTSGTGTNWASGATSKYLAGAALTNANTAYEGTAPFTVANADMICESCHNIVINTTNTANDNDLLVGAYRDNQVDGICTGCHAQDEAATGRQAFHANDNLPAFAGGRKRHHVMTGDQLKDGAGGYGTNGADSVMWAPSASNRLLNAWCSAPYTTQTAPTPLDLVAGVGILFRDACNVAGSGSRAYTAVAALGDITPTANNAINCSNCHRPHNAQAGSGAFILRMGDTTKGDFVGNAGAGKFTGLTNASRFYGIRRQSDVDSSYSAKVYQEYRPLCAGCHYGY